MTTTIRGLLTACLVVASAVTAPAFATNGYFQHGIGSRAKATAGSGAASNSDQGPAIVATNPALANFTTRDWEVGAAIFSPRRSYTAGTSLANGNGGAFTIGAGQFESGKEWFPVPYAARQWSLARERKLSVMFYGRGGMNTQWDDPSAHALFDPDGPGPAPVSSLPGPFGGGEAGVDLSQAFLIISLAGKSGDRLAWGIGPVLAAQAFSAKGVGAFAPYTRDFAQSGGTVLPESLSNNGHDWSFGAGLTAGLWYGVTDTFSLGLSFQSAIRMSAFDDYASLFAEQGRFDIPQNIKLGGSWQLSDSFRINLDADHAQFNEPASVGNPVVNIVGCPTAGAGGNNLEACLGGDAGAGFGWKDMTTYKLGIEWRTNSNQTWRFGYSHGRKPVQPADGLFNILAPGVQETHLTTGLTQKVGAREVTVALMYSPSKTVAARNLFDPTQTLDLTMRQFELEVSVVF